MRRLMIMMIFLFSSVGVNANPPILIFIDGVAVGTMTVFEYLISRNEIWVETDEIVFDCKQDIIFKDNFSSNPTPPILIFVDGALVGTLSIVEYLIDSSAIWIETNEIVFGCNQQGIISQNLIVDN